MTADRRAPGRPRDPDLADRFIDGAVRMILNLGLHRFSVDAVAADLRAGKAAFYRRWPTTDHFLADVAHHLDAAPVDGLTAEALLQAAGEPVRRLASRP